MNQWEREFRMVQFMVHTFYGAGLVYAGMIYFRIPAVAHPMPESGHLLFPLLFLIALASFPLSQMFGGRQISAQILAQKLQANADRILRMSAGMNSIRTAAILMAAFGESCAVYGLILYLLTGDTTRPWLFIGLSAVHYAWNMARLRLARVQIAAI